MTRKRTAKQEKSYFELMQQLTELDAYVDAVKQKKRLIPSDWRRIEAEVPVRRRKAKVTAAFDADVVKWFQAMGHGYQARMNAVLRTFMLALVSKEILSDSDYDYVGRETWGVADKGA